MSPHRPQLLHLPCHEVDIHKNDVIESKSSFGGYILIYEAVADIWSAFKEYNNQAILFAIAAVIIYSVAIIMHNVINAFRGKQFLNGFKVAAKMCIFAIFGMYASYAICLTLSGREAGSRTGMPSLVPGATIFTGSGISIFSVENWLLFIPFGVLVPILWKYNRSVIMTGLLAFISSVTIEVTQFITARGYFEVDDILLNTFGAICGYVIFACCYDGFLGIKKRIITDIAKEKRIAPPLGNLYNRYFVCNEWALIFLQSLPVIFSVKMIMGFSSDVGEKSRELSRPVAYVFVKIMGVFGNSRDVARMADVTQLMNFQSDYLDMIEKIIRKVAHVTEYAFLAFCVWALIFARCYVKRIFSYMVAVLSVFIVGINDELNQTSVDGRYGSMRDVGIDLIGAVLVIVPIIIIVHLWRNYYKKKL